MNIRSSKTIATIKISFKRIINWDNYQSKVTIQVLNPYLDYISDPSFQGVYRFFVLSFEKNTNRTVHTKYYFPTIEIKHCNVTIDEQNFLDKSVKSRHPKNCDWSKKLLHDSLSIRL